MKREKEKLFFIWLLERLTLDYFEMTIIEQKNKKEGEIGKVMCLMDNDSTN